MCGIVGFNFNNQNLVQRLSTLLAHRGPDRSHFYVDNSVSLAHRRLSIIDLSPRGTQPMCNENRSLWVVFNGEIFNYRKLQSELTNSGHSFTSETDTEVLLHAYEEYGTGMFEKLDGQFSFCLYDKSAQKLLLARDRMGILPLYYYHAGDTFIFSSELKALLCSGVPKNINENALVSYLRFGYIPSPECILANAHKLMPAHFLVFDLTSRKIELCKRYWSLAAKPDNRKPEGAEETLARMLEKAVRSRLIGDVPVGAFLSGGIDSSAICFLIKKYKKKLKTFSVRFDYRNYDESAYAHIMSRMLDTEHYEITFGPGDLKAIVPRLALFYDEPFGDSSAIPMYLVSRIARKHVTVSLSGDGGDELLGGYNRYRYFYVARRLHRLPRWCKACLRGLLCIPGSIFPRFELDRVKEILRLDGLSDRGIYEVLCEKIERRELGRLLKRRIPFDETAPCFEGADPLNAMQQYDIHRYLEGDILVKVDRAAMAHSLETRPPFLDHHLVQYCMTLPSRMKLRGICGKWLLRKAFRGILPEAIITRKKKGFTVPLAMYMNSELKDFLARYVFDYSHHSFFDRDMLRQMANSRRDTTRLFWNIMMFNMWHERWIAGKAQSI